MTIQVLYFDGCPNVEGTFDLVQRLATAHHPAVLIEKVRVDSQPEAVHRRFLGSPTVRIDGLDIETAARHRTDFGMVCRLYGQMGLPSADLIASAMREAAD